MDPRRPASGRPSPAQPARSLRPRHPRRRVLARSTCGPQHRAARAGSGGRAELEPCPDAAQGGGAGAPRQHHHVRRQVTTRSAWLDRAEAAFAALGDTDVRVLRAGPEDPRKPPSPGELAGPPCRRGAARTGSGAIPGALSGQRRPTRRALLPRPDAARLASAGPCGGSRRRGGGTASEQCAPVRLRGRQRLLAPCRDSRRQRQALRRRTQDYGAAAGRLPPDHRPDPLPHPPERWAPGDDAARDGLRDAGTARREVEASAEALARVRKGSNTHAQSLERVGLAYVRAGSVRGAAIPSSRNPGRSGPSAARRSCGTAPTLALAQARCGARARTPQPGRCSTRRSPWSVGSPRTALVPEGDVHLVRGLIAVDRGETAEAHTALAQALTLSGWETRADLTRRVMADAGRARAWRCSPAAARRRWPRRSVCSSW